eukprot:CAMPEP_0175830080 /NCGR_PEP_ID=MMETSP0107_2-20121207/13727_1 /TAXON_ID=195067 ORGANISM="Goniomonas pacifica, Strain CCMP1869" /NCGR_SAMPLE_ID=MMETSP0107_2 /ASSEMBLY_ACC=CAM_ASM_000203 /LENGTH=54 /DNA_ID=CAMNT_0017143001 /DNA_START=299 /DNA_END=463 /DNA_ORIENTATION=-
MSAKGSGASAPKLRNSSTQNRCSNSAPRLMSTERRRATQSPPPNLPSQGSHQLQ